MTVRVAVTQERHAGETRVAATPETVKKLIAAGCEVVVESGAGLKAAYPDADYEAAGASLAKTLAEDGYLIMGAYETSAHQTPAFRPVPGLRGLYVRNPSYKLAA